MPTGFEEEQFVGEEQSVKMVERPQAVAPWFHTAFILGVLLLWATYSLFRAALPINVMPRLVTYMSSIIIQLLLVGSTIAGLYHRRQFIVDVVGGFTRQRWLRDIAIGGATYFGAGVVAVLVWVVLKFIPLHLVHRTDIVRAMAPHSRGELALWLMVSASAGICEEFIFRGYLQRQLTGWLRSAPVAIVVCSVLFGCLHFYQGTAGVVQIAMLGALYGGVAQWRGNLRSVMVAHFLQDAISGTLLYLRLH